MTAHPDSKQPSPDAPEVRLARLLKANGCIVYQEELPDREYPQIKCSIYGAPKTNELFVRISNGRNAFVGVTASPVTSPVMGDRVFGLDAADQAVAFRLADQLWEAHRAELTRGLRKK